MSVKIFVLLLVALMAGVGADAVKGESSTEDPFVLKVHKDFYDDDHWIDQILFRSFHISYGHRNLVAKSNRLKSLLVTPPYGRFRDHCLAFEMLRKDLFFLGTLVPDFAFLYFSTLGRTLQGSSNPDGSPKPYVKFFDDVSLKMGCQGYQADELMLKLFDYYNDAAIDFGRLGKDYGVKDIMNTMQQRLNHVNTEPDVIFNAKDCQFSELRNYILDKLAEIQEEYESLSLDATDKELGNVFEHFRDLSPVATTYFLCVGCQDRLAKEVDGDVIYEMRKVLHLMMAKEQEKERKLLSEIQDGSFQLDRRNHRRYTFTTVPKNSVFSCLGMNETLPKDKKFVVRACFTRCQELVEEERRMMKEGCKNDDGSPTECQFCQVSVPKEESDRFWATSFTNVKVDKGDHTIYHFPSHNYSSMVPPLLTKADVLKLLSYNIDYVRPPPPDYYHHQEPMGKFRFPYEEPEQIDWKPYLWLSLKTAICTTLAIWSLYFYNVYRFRFGRWLNRRWEDLYRRIVGM